MNADYLRMLFDYTYWAHRKVWGCVEMLTDAQFTQDLGYSWGSIRGQVVHVMSAETVWFSRIQGRSPTALASETGYPTRSSIRNAWDAVEAAMRAYLSALDDAMLQRDIVYRTTKGVEHRQPLFEILAHVANHGTDHRAQILAMLHQLGAPTLEQDMLHYFRERFNRL